MAPGDAEDIRTRLRRALPPAMKARDQTTVAARRSAARGYQDAGQSGHAERLRAEADLLSGYLNDPDTPT
jgi:uncharacterized protein YqeY